MSDPSECHIWNIARNGAAKTLPESGSRSTESITKTIWPNRAKANVPAFDQLALLQHSLSLGRESFSVAMRVV